MASCVVSLNIIQVILIKFIQIKLVFYITFKPHMHIYGERLKCTYTIVCYSDL